MIFKPIEQLSMIEIDGEDENIVTFDRLAKLLLEKPSNMVYCVKEGKLHGIISMGDVHRAKVNGRNSVDIKTSFTFLHGYEYMRARKLFLENEKINALPIVDEEHHLIGDYSRWDDAFSGYSFDFLKGNKYADMVWKKYRKVAIVQPNYQIPSKMKMVGVWEKFFHSVGIEAEIIQKQDIIKSFDDKDMVFFSDEDEMRGLETLYTDILDKEFGWAQTKTLEAVGKAVEEAIGEAVAKAVGEAVLREFIDKGIYLMTIQVKGSGTDYWKKIERELKEKFERIGKKRKNKLYKEFWEDFFGEIYSEEYAKDIASHQYICIRDGMDLKLKDTTSKYYNVKDGERLTIGQPQEYCNTIYFFGRCVAIGQRAEDAHTIESFLQEELNKEGYKVRVVNYGNWGNRLQLLHRICSTDFMKGNIAIVFDDGRDYQGIPNLNLGEVLEKNHVSSKCFINLVYHANHKVYKMWAEEIYTSIPKYLLTERADEKAKSVKVPSADIIQADINRYFAGHTPKGKTGAIVMNCNPFTLGHRYLIEQAMEKVDELIIFVVEENQSLFSFKERFAMVKEGTKDIRNIIVVPSGQYILSQSTFPEYFIKIEDVDLKKNAENDIKLFAEEIAPKLNIKYRFVGEEKTDVVTAEYNNAMKKILPQHGIELIEIPRKIGAGGSPISATDVRTLLDAGRFEDVREMVPQTTFDILMKSWT